MSVRGKKKDGDETMLRVWELRQPPNNYPQAKIALELGITQSAVSKALSRARKLYGSKLDKDKERVRQDIEETLDRLDYLFFEAMSAWDRSKKTIKETHVEKNVPVIIGGAKMYAQAQEEGRDKAEGEQRLGLKLTGQGLKTVGYFDKVKVTKVRRDGNHNFLFSAISILREMSELKGIKAPVKTALTDPTGEKEAGLTDQNMADKEIANRLLSILGRARKRRDNGKH